MLTFASLLLGLTVGVVEIELLAQGEVNAIEVFLDGERIGVLDEPPWTIECDFGDALEPHELTAVGLDDEGREVARAKQWVNLPRPPAEITAIFEDRAGPGEDVVARVRWATLAGARAPVARAWFDGVELKVDDPGAIDLPAFDVDQLHFFRVELAFPGNVVSTFEATLGGSYADNIKSDLTAVLLNVKTKKGPTLADLQGSLTKGGEALEVVAIERPPAQIVVVRDRAAEDAFSMLNLRSQSMGDTGVRGRFSGTSSDPRSRFDRVMSRRHSKWRLEFVWPVADRRRGAGGQLFDLFRHSPALRPRDGSIFRFLTRLAFPPDLVGDQRLADGLAVAGVSAAALGGRRMAVLVLGKEGEDASGMAPELVRRYLEQIQVPLRVWATSKPADSAWGEVTKILPRRRLDAAWRVLLEDLNHQRVAWVRGSHLPQSIELAPTKGVELAR